MTTALTTTDKPALPVAKDVRELLQRDDFKSKIAMALPGHIKPDRMMRIAATAAQKNPALLKASPSSFMMSMLDLSAAGLEPDGRRAALVCYKDECKAMIMYQGLVELIMRTGLVSRVHADVVCANDDFEFDRGEVKQHKIDLKKERGEAYAAYAIVSFKDGTSKAEVMTKAEIESIRDRSQGYQAFKKGYTKSNPWQSDPMEMWKKTAFRRCAKWVPVSNEYRDALDLDDAIDIQSSVVTSEPVRPIFDIPEPAEEPKQLTEETPAVVVEQARARTALGDLRQNMAKDKIEEGELLAYLRGVGMIEESISRIDDAYGISPSSIEKVNAAWVSVSKDVKKSRKAS